MLNSYREGNGFVAAIEGRITTDKAEEFHRKLLFIVDQNSGDCLLDMTLAEYLCSSVVGTVAQVLKKLRERDNDLFVCCLNKDVNTLFKVTRLSRIIEVFETLEQGTQRLKGASL